MNSSEAPLPVSDTVAMSVERALQRLHASSPEAQAALADATVRMRLSKLACASDFAIATLCRQPTLLARLAADAQAPASAMPALDAENRGEWESLLRRHRAAESTRLIWRDVLGFDDVDATLAGTTRLAEDCLQAALAALEAEFAGRHGVFRGDDGQPRRLIVFGLGKLGGGELNFSSDVDLVYGYDLDGVVDPLASDGARPLAAEAYFARLGQQLARLIDEVTADGFCHRVDLRLRPYGGAGRVAWSFTAMEQYFQHEGRDWERYAWQKARPVAGDIEAGERFLVALRPFIYRRYLDFGALDGLRTMKAAIAAEVARKDMADDIKRGPGGIREIEFLIQSLQLIRGGREPELRGRALLPSLQALVDARQVEPDAAVTLAAAYRFLRRLENRLQMLGDAQVHALPGDPVARERIAIALDFPDWHALRVELERQRAIVSVEFGALLAPRRAVSSPGALALYWHALPDAGSTDILADAGFDEAGEADTLLRDLARSPAVSGLSDRARARLDRVLPALLQGAARAGHPMLALRRLLALLHNILRRSAYLALLDEQPAALARLVEVVSQSALLAERLARYPLLLDELLDARVSGPLPDRCELKEACAAVPGGDDAEIVLQALNEVRQTLGFRIAMAFRDSRQDAGDSARQLAWLADGVVARVLELAWHEVASAHGEVPAARFVVLGYGSLGGEELGFGSDLDLVFLYDADPMTPSSGVRPLEASRWFARLAQKIVALLGVVTAAGRLYEVDVRLRPDGAKGLLVSSLASYSDYQRERAWTWEHQALVRARVVAGDDGLGGDFERVRGEILARPRDPAALSADVLHMRRRMRAELDRSDAATSDFRMFDLKQGEGGLVDLEFLLQALVLRHGLQHPALLAPRHTPGLIDAACREGVLDADTATSLHAAHAHLLEAGLSCTLDRRARRIPRDEALDRAREAIRRAARSQGLDFGFASD
ncbi:bifunctional [glutamate--ammonia ligase]-adenylyl-L-tyrosine phosphorylase/[glutamate--ammonia-ligase] adenylyltransferase [Marilutibacter alkalisoli]|uniref:Bifunctional glutamine synthetase adenylyltransferase/adenylyl-removing enzyme n=1 Tax=Marilutibacter alkalisoli TaxID=2591633 RepID=A0A514BNX4_9GAMM|nr:bifunctional [glutamate--ammonia ligase]-adenylyl-L-tyrosine phosphorylase/[glutamate--ammonia-ligase] adenylyltransferase [Lysobacter alkalisoli]QDH69083.1 bifunctional [glutamate--ammonia ligase]-adenylyl-L-tyrosine phosphorylase/[glutamate--ammonia-ligase] adenylyltransferase [Lysobacter alkalisoli]